MTGRKGGRPMKRSRTPIPSRERALIGMILLNVLWLAFAMGGVKVWGEMTSVALSLATFFLLPKWETGEIQGMSSPAIQLLKLPLFWIGFGLYTFFFIQTWNLSWEWQQVAGRARLVSVQPVYDWLPSSIQSPLDEANPLRSMTFYLIPWITCCAAWAGLNTRRSVQTLLHGLAWIGVLFAILALHQHFNGLRVILGIFPELPTREKTDIPFWGTLHNCNHAAYYLIIITGVCLGLFLHGWYRDLKQFKQSGGAWLLYLGLAFLTTFSVLMAQARGAIIFILIFWCLFILICTIFFIMRFGLAGLALPGVFGVIALAITATFVINPDVFENQKEDWIRTFTLVENPELHGAGSWRYLHLPYLQNYPEFKTDRVRWEKNAVTGKYKRRDVTIWFKSAHVDILEYIVEWGIIGCLFPLLAALWLFYRFIRSYRGWDPGLFTILAGVVVVFFGTIVEFHFRIPLVLLVWCLVLTLTIKLAQLNAQAST
jgi:hypothetical protein